MKVRLAVLVTLLIILCGVLYHFGYIFTGPVTTFRRGVVIGNTNLSGKLWNEGIQIINETFNTPVYLNAETSSRAITLKDIGIDIDRDRLFRYTKICRYSNPRIFCRNTSNEPVDSAELLSIKRELLNEYLDSLEGDFTYINKANIVSLEDYSFKALSDSIKVVLDRTSFETKKGILELMKKGKLTLGFKTKSTGQEDNQREKTLNLIEKVTTPLLIKYGGTPVYIPTDTMETFVKTETRDEELYGVVPAENVTEYLNTLKETYESDSVKVIDNSAVQAIRNAILYRAANGQINKAVILPIEGLPKTNGELHDVYLEVIKSQQRLYRFEQGELVKTYIVSTGVTWDTPAGNYSVLGKQRMTISYFGAWYMPYYLPLGTIGGQYYFGFHEIPYHVDAAGNIYSRDENTMGSPATGGCIQLTREDAIELFEWAWVGIPVYIHE